MGGEGHHHHKHKHKHSDGKKHHGSQEEKKIEVPSDGILHADIHMNQSAIKQCIQKTVALVKSSKISTKDYWDYVQGLKLELGFQDDEVHLAHDSPKWKYVEAIIAFIIFCVITYFFGKTVAEFEAEKWDEATAQLLENLRNTRESYCPSIPPEKLGNFWEGLGLPDPSDPANRKNPWTSDHGQHAIFYAFTVLTTVGYGNLAPKTPDGQVATIIFAVLAIPMSGFVFSKIAEAIIILCLHSWQKAKVWLMRKGCHRSGEVNMHMTTADAGILIPILVLVLWIKLGMYIFEATESGDIEMPGAMRNNNDQKGSGKHAKRSS